MSARLTAYIALIGALASAAALSVTSGAPSPTVTVPIWCIVIAAAVSELCTTEVEFRGEGLEITFAHACLAFGLFLVPRGELLVAMAAGVAVVRVFYRRQPAMKFVFNLSMLVLDGAVAIAVFDRFADAGRFEPLDWVVLLGALSSANLVSVVAVTGVIRVATGRLFFTAFSVSIGLVISAALGTIALAMVAAYWTDPRTLVLFIVPLALLRYAFVVFERQRAQKEQVELLFRVAQAGSAIGALDERMERFLTEVVTSTLARSATVIVRSAETQAHLFTVTVTPDDVAFSTDPPAEPSRAAIDAFLGGPVASALVTPGDRSAAQAVLATVGQECGIVTALKSAEGSPFAVLVLGARESDPWTDEDRKLAQTLGDVLAPAVAADEQLSTIGELRALRDELRFQATHDQLTGLANRSLFMDAIEAELHGAAATCGLLYLDLDGFKAVNDSLGHSIGDALLCAVAGRLESTVGERGLVVRLGGDEFAIVCAAADAATLEALAHRIIENVGHPYPIGPDPVVIGVSIGGAVAAVGTTSQDLVHRADEAMYMAKRGGRNRYVAGRWTTDGHSATAPSAADLARR